MKVLKIALILLVVYAGVVVAFESLIGFFQPADGSTLVITTFDEEGAPHDRVVSRIDSAGNIYVAANHWPRGWYDRALEDANVQGTQEGKAVDYLAVSVSGAEHDRVDRENGLGVALRFLTGFPPRKFLRLDPR